MDVADKIGLLPGFGWIAGHGLFTTLFICWAITPLGHNLVGWIGESRWVPWSPDKQFLSFFPGDLFLGTMVAGLLLLAQRLPSEDRWYNSTTWHIIVLIGAFVIAAIMTYAEWKGGVYPTRAIFSPTKIYHNFALYGLYGYVIVTTLVAVVSGSSWSWSFAGLLALVLLPGIIWASFIPLDSTIGAKPAVKAQYAHVADWKPIWRR